MRSVPDLQLRAHVLSGPEFFTKHARWCTASSHSMEFENLKLKSLKIYWSKVFSQLNYNCSYLQIVSAALDRTQAKNLMCLVIHCCKRFVVVVTVDVFVATDSLYGA